MSGQRSSASSRAVAYNRSPATARGHASGRGSSPSSPGSSQQTPPPVGANIALTALTDGVGNTYIPFFKDKDGLNQKTYTYENFAPIGVNMPNDGPNPHSNLELVQRLRDFGIRGVRYEVQWGIVEEYAGSYNWDAYSINSDITYLKNNGCTICIEAGYTPGFRTGQRYRVYPPLISVDTPVELVFSGGQAVIPGAPVFVEDRNGERQGPFLVDAAETKQSVSLEMASFAYVDENNNRYTRTSSQGWADKYCAYTSNYPIDLSTLVVQVETAPNSNNWETWTRVPRIDATSSGKVYCADHTGRIAFRDSRMLSGGAVAPATGARVRVSYQYYTTVYQRPTAYSLDKITGVVTKGAAGFSVPEMQNDFSSGFGASWQWHASDNAPNQSERIYDGFPAPTLHNRWSISGTQPTYTVDGKFNVTMPASGAAEVLASLPNGYSKDWLLVVDMSSVSMVSGGEVGLVARKDANNYVRVYMNNSGELCLDRVEGGSSQITKLGWTWSRNRKIFLRKLGNQFQAWVEGLQDTQARLTSTFATSFTTSSVGMWIKAGAGGSTVVSFDDLYFIGPYELPELSIVNNQVQAVIRSGIEALYLQPVTGGSANFQISIQTSMPGGSGANRAAVGIYVRQDANNWVKVQQISDGGTNRKFRVTAVQNGTTVHDLMDGFYEAETVTLTLQRVGDTFTATITPKTAYATNRTFTLAGFVVNWAGIIMEHQPQRNPITVTLDNWTVTAASEQIPNTVKCLYTRVDLGAVQAFGASLAQQFGDRVRHFEYGNEISNGPGWTFTGGVGIYAKCLEAFSQGVKSVLPDAKVLNAGWADNHSLVGLHSELYQYINKDVFDIAAWHPYWFSRDYPGTGFNNHIQVMLNELADGNDNNKQIFAGEFSVPCAALAGSGVGSADGPNERRQAEYAFHAVCKMFRTGRYSALQWWPGKDAFPAGHSSASESVFHGNRDGLFSADNDNKPVLYMLSEIALCRGILIDLVTYSESGPSKNSPIPADAKYNLGSLDIKVRPVENLENIIVEASWNGWPAGATVTKVCAVTIGGNKVIPVNIDPNTQSLQGGTVYMAYFQNENKWKFSNDPDLDTNPLSTIISEAAPNTPNHVVYTGVSLTTPDAPQSGNEKWVFDIPVGHGWHQVGAWNNTNPNLTGESTINIPLDQGSITTGRYIRVLMKFKQGSSYVEVAQVVVKDNNGNNISNGKLYYASGWEPN